MVLSYSCVHVYALPLYNYNENIMGTVLWTYTYHSMGNWRITRHPMSTHLFLIGRLYAIRGKLSNTACLYIVVMFFLQTCTSMSTAWGFCYKRAMLVVCHAQQLSNLLYSGKFCFQLLNTAWLRHCLMLSLPYHAIDHRQSQTKSVLLQLDRKIIWQWLGACSRLYYKSNSLQRAWTCWIWMLNV